MDLFLRVTRDLLEGLGMTARLFALTLVFSLPLGLVISFGSMSKFLPLKFITKAFVWVIRGTPLMLTMFLAGLQGIPGDYYEAARVDGASAWYSFRKITLPLLLPVIMVSGVLRFIWTFNFYDLPWVMTQGGPADATTTTPVYAYRRAFTSYRLGEGSAISIILFIVLLIFAFIYFRAKKYQDKIYK